MVRRTCRPIPATPPTLEVLSYFSHYDWATKLLTDTSLTPYPAPCRNGTTPGQHTLFSSTLNTNSTIPQMQALYRPPCESQPLGEFMWILSLGGAMNAHVGYMHGGIAGLLVDQVMGEVAHSFMGGAEKEGAKPGDELFNKAGMPIDGRVALTIESNIRYRRPVLMPGVVIVRAWLDPKSIGPVGSPPGRKMWVHAVLEDGEGGVSIEAESFWLEVNQVKGML